LEIENMETMYRVRRDNLKKLSIEKFEGNKAALARAAGVHPNHINLMLSDNELHRRNLGEELARRIEEAVGLPRQWFDQPHGADADASITIPAHPIDASLAGVLKASPVTMTVARSWLTDRLVGMTAPENVFIATLSTGVLAPQISAGDLILVDGGVKSFVDDGVYILVSKEGAFVRGVRKALSGGFQLVTGSGSESVDTLKGIKVVGRLLRRVSLDSPL
jgi:hypothetical protein